MTDEAVLVGAMLTLGLMGHATEPLDALPFQAFSAAELADVWRAATALRRGHKRVTLVNVARMLRRERRWGGDGQCTAELLVELTSDACCIVRWRELVEAVRDAWLDRVHDEAVTLAMVSRLLLARAGDELEALATRYDNLPQDFERDVTNA